MFCNCLLCSEMPFHFEILFNSENSICRDVVPSNYFTTMEGCAWRAASKPIFTSRWSILFGWLVSVPAIVKCQHQEYVDYTLVCKSLNHWIGPHHLNRHVIKWQSMSSIKLREHGNQAHNLFTFVCIFNEDNEDMELTISRSQCLWL